MKTVLGQINIPKAMLSEYKRDKHSCELLAMSICIKCRFSDSLMKDVSARKVQALLHCGFDKAKKLLALAKESKLFKYNSYTNNLLAVDFKKDYTRTFQTKDGKHHKSVYVAKIEKKEYSLRELLSLFHDLLFLSAVNAVERRDEFECKNKDKNLSFVSRTPLTQKKIGNIAGLNNRKAVYRMIKRLERNGSISYTKSQLLYATNCLSDDALKERNLHETFLVVDDLSGVGYVVAYPKYGIKDRRIKEGITNVILDHKKRMVNHAKTKNVTAVEMYFERMEH